jgi:hypothetical protein
MFSILVPVRTRQALVLVEKLTDWELLQSLASEPLSPDILIHSSNEADKAARDFAASVALAYRTSTRKTAIAERKYEKPGLDLLVKQKKKAQKIMARNQGASMQNGSKLGLSKYQEDGSKRSTRKMTEKLANCEVTPQAVWPIAKSLTEKDGPKAQSAIRSPLGPICFPSHKANVTADCLENQFRVHDLCDCDHRQHVEVQVEALLATVDEDIPVNF